MDKIPQGEYRVRPKEGQEEKVQEPLTFKSEETDLWRSLRRGQRGFWESMESGEPRETAAVGVAARVALNVGSRLR